MTPNEDNSWNRWIAARLEVRPDEDLIDRIMNDVQSLERQQNVAWTTELIMKLEHNLFARMAVCAAALLIGGLPFLFLAYIAKFL